MPFSPTAEQSLIIETAQTTTENLLISARAGAAKTTTIEMIAAALPAASILSLAFNKKIADELKLRLPPNCSAATLNAIGHRAWQELIGRRLRVDGRKIYQLLNAALAELSPAERKEVGDNYNDLIDGIKTAKAQGYLPEAVHSRARPLLSDDSFFDMLDFQPTPLECDLINTVVVQSFRQSLDGFIDYDDQILCPTIMPASFPLHDIVMIDEAQDLSRINQLMLQKIVRNKRLIAVGDACQAIYGFRGASENSMSELRRMFSMKELHLTICFRSAQAIIREARWRAPDMQWRPDAPEGSVQTLFEWTAETLQDGDAIICRNNAPLFRMAITLLRAKLHPELGSTDIIKGLLTVMKKFGPASLESALALQAVDAWEAAQLDRVRSKGRVRDQAACIRVFLNETATLGDAMTFLRDVAQRPGRIKLMTGHKAKGLEFDRVFFLDQHLLKKEGQDLNLRYVIQTRAREELYYVNSGDWSDANAG